jgi:hypothetical protein
LLVVEVPVWSSKLTMSKAAPVLAAAAYCVVSSAVWKCCARKIGELRCSLAFESCRRLEQHLQAHACACNALGLTGELQLFLLHGYVDIVAVEQV